MVSQQDCDGKWCVEKVHSYVTEVDTDVGEDDDIIKQQNCCDNEEMVYMIASPQTQVSVNCTNNISACYLTLFVLYRRLCISSTGTFAILVIEKLASLLG